MFDMFEYIEQHRLLVCVACGVAIQPAQAKAHLRATPHRLGGHRLRAALDDLRQRADRCPLAAEYVLPAHLDDPVPRLPVYKDGFRCLLRMGGGECRYVCRSKGTMRNHWQREHCWTVADGHQGGSGRPKRERIARRELSALVRVDCQRFFAQGPHSAYVEVRTSTEGPASQFADLTAPRDPVAAGLDELRALQAAQQQGADDIDVQASRTEVSPWLELTQWPQYLQGHSLRAAAAAGTLPDPQAEEPLLMTICGSVDRLVERAYDGICSNRINAFDQARVNSFLRRPRASDRPLMVKLQKATFRRYKGIWKRLLAFVYRTSRPDRSPPLFRHRFTAHQLTSLEECLFQAQQVAEGTAGPGLAPEERNGEDVRLDRLDTACLQLCMSLLDHDLRADLFDSVVVGFFAVLAIDIEKGNLRDALTFYASVIRIHQDRADARRPADY